MARAASRQSDYANLFWAAGLGIGASAVFLFLQFSPRPFLTTIAAILWLVALMGVAALVQLRQARVSLRRSERIAWRMASVPYLLAVAILIADPLLGRAGLAYALAGGLGVAGGARVIAAFETRRRGGGWLYISGAMTMAVAIVIGFGWPFAVVAPVIAALALDLLVLGIIFILSLAGGRS
ncbi:hypothetical protein [Sphingopyxis kveilinensis]|uniref:hypothetical protein n=1 Tax=Sphingopyxis kveilinensis TaxID=3114367 RepID=UPI0030D0193B